MAFGRDYHGYHRTERWTIDCGARDPECPMDRCEAEVRVSISGGYPNGSVEDIPATCPAGHVLDEDDIAQRVMEDVGAWLDPSNHF